MIFFRITENLNVKTTDGTLVKYFKFKGPSNLNNETAYITTGQDYEDFKVVLDNVDKDKYKVRYLKEELIRSLDEYPIELGVSNEFEYQKTNQYKKLIQNHHINDKDEINTFLQEHKKINLFEQLILNKDKITIAFIGNMGDTIGEMICSCTALRILYDKLKSKYKEIVFDIYLNASNNSFYSRDKDIYENQSFVNKVYPLSINVKKFCSYDYYFDNSMFTKNNSYYKELNFVDAWLFKFGIDYMTISNELKFNQINIDKIKPSEDLKKRIENAKFKGKLLLFHPYTADINRSIPQEQAVRILKQLLKKNDEYNIATTLKIDSKFKDSGIIDFSNDSKTFSDFTYIISNMDAIITSETSTLHISDAFMIPTIVIATNNNIYKKIKYYSHVRAVEVKDESKNMSNLIFDNENLTLYKFESWKKLKTRKVMKLLAKI